VLTDEAGVVEHFGMIARDNIGLDRHGAPRPDDLHQAWAGGGRAILWTPHPLGKSGLPFAANG
jgi:hypothetical protein